MIFSIAAENGDFTGIGSQEMFKDGTPDDFFPAPKLNDKSTPEKLGRKTKKETASSPAVKKRAAHQRCSRKIIKSSAFALVLGSMQLA